MLHYSTIYIHVEGEAFIFQKGHKSIFIYVEYTLKEGKTHLPYQSRENYVISELKRLGHFAPLFLAPAEIWGTLRSPGHFMPYWGNL